jgi:photosystem II stability/assembly factor-like uncharacterized protein
MRGRALLIATAHYSDPQLAALPSASVDATGLQEVLSRPEIGDFAVTACLDSPSHEWRQRIEGFFSDAGRDETLLLYITGHGVKDKDGRLYFAAADTRLERLLATGVAASFIQEASSTSRSRRVLMIFDTCFSGAFARGFQLKADSQAVNAGEYFRESTGRVVITASDAIQYSLAGGESSSVGNEPDTLAQSSLFSRHIIEGLRTGKADIDGDGLITSEDLFRYVAGSVQGETRTQRPQRWAFGLDGDLIVASNPLPRPGKLPQDVIDFLEDSRAEVRMLALGKLERLLAAQSMPLALAARQALARLLDDDSRAITHEAASILQKGGATTAASGAPALAEPSRSPPASDAAEAMPPSAAAGVQHGQSPQSRYGELRQAVEQAPREGGRVSLPGSGRQGAAAPTGSALTGPPAPSPSDRQTTQRARDLPRSAAKEADIQARQPRGFLRGWGAMRWIWITLAVLWLAVCVVGAQLQRFPDLNSVQMLGDGLGGWAVGTDTAISTSDGGRTWVKRGGIAKRDLTSIVFAADGQHGWATGAYVVCTTVDGGQHWLEQYVGGYLSSVSFAADGQHGWAVGEVRENGQSVGLLIATADGGKSWVRQAVPKGTTWLLSVHFTADGAHGWAAGLGGVIATDDGGSTWVLQTTLLTSSFYFAADGQRGWAVGLGKVIATTDGGKNWVEQFLSIGGDLDSVYFAADGQHGWAVGAEFPWREHGRLLATDDGGKSWREQPLPEGTPKLRWVQFTSDGQRGAAVGEHGTVVATQDGGKTWTSVGPWRWHRLSWWLAALLSLPLLVLAYRSGVRPMERAPQPR